MLPTILGLSRVIGDSLSSLSQKDLFLSGRSETASILSLFPDYIDYLKEAKYVIRKLYPGIENIKDYNIERAVAFFDAFTGQSLKQFAIHRSILRKSCPIVVFDRRSEGLGEENNIIDEERRTNNEWTLFESLAGSDSAIIDRDLDSLNDEYTEYYVASFDYIASAFGDGFNTTNIRGTNIKDFLTHITSMTRSFKKRKDCPERMKNNKIFFGLEIIESYTYGNDSGSIGIHNEDMRDIFIHGVEGLPGLLLCIDDVCIDGINSLHTISKIECILGSHSHNVGMMKVDKSFRDIINEKKEDLIERIIALIINSKIKYKTIVIEGVDSAAKIDYINVLLEKLDVKDKTLRNNVSFWMQGELFNYKNELDNVS